MTTWQLVFASLGATLLWVVLITFCGAVLWRRKMEREPHEQEQNETTTGPNSPTFQAIGSEITQVAGNHIRPEASKPAPLTPAIAKTNNKHQNTTK